MLLGLVEPATGDASTVERLVTVDGVGVGPMAGSSCVSDPDSSSTTGVSATAAACLRRRRVVTSISRTSSTARNRPTPIMTGRVATSVACLSAGVAGPR